MATDSPGEPAMRSSVTFDFPASTSIRAPITSATTGAAVSEPPPPCSTTQATTYLGASKGA